MTAGRRVSKNSLAKKPFNAEAAPNPVVLFSADRPGRRDADWPEFVAGSDYDVDLRSSATGESVSVRYVDREDGAYVVITSDLGAALFDRVAGRVIYALSPHTDYLIVYRG